MSECPCTLTTENPPVAAIPKKKRRGKDKVYRVTVKSSGEVCNDRTLHTSIFESLLAVSNVREEIKGVAENER